MKGAYILILEAREDGLIKVGSWGYFRVRKGYYAYVGSASGRYITIDKRVERHKRLASEKSGKLRWHIDYLLTSRCINLAETIPVKTRRRVECILSRRLEELADDVVLKFGSSDCKGGCKGHLYYFNRKPNLKLRGDCISSGDDLKF